MASDSSFDIASKVDMQEVVNGIDIAMREIVNRYDFKDSNTTIDLNKEERKITIHSLDDYKVNASWDILQNKFAKRGVPLKAMKASDPVTSGLNKTHKEIIIQDGIPQEKAKEIVKAIKDAKLKVQASIQKDVVRVSGPKKDDLQAVMAMLREKDFGVDMQFTNYR
jgi:cyclic-di-GMP-binding protein